MNEIWLFVNVHGMCRLFGVPRQEFVADLLTKHALSVGVGVVQFDEVPAHIAALMR